MKISPGDYFLGIEYVESCFISNCGFYDKAFKCYGKSVLERAGE